MGERIRNCDSDIVQYVFHGGTMPGRHNKPSTRLDLRKHCLQNNGNVSTNYTHYPIFFFTFIVDHLDAKQFAIRHFPEKIDHKYFLSKKPHCVFIIRWMAFYMVLTFSSVHFVFSLSCLFFCFNMVFFSQILDFLFYFQLYIHCTFKMIITYCTWNVNVKVHFQTTYKCTC